MKMFICGEWVSRDEVIEVRNPFDGSVVDTVPVATEDDVAACIESAAKGAAIMRKMPARERYEILHRASNIMAERQEDLGRTISLEEGKVLGEGIFEASRALETMILSAEEAKRIRGDVLPLDAAPGGEGKLGFTLRVPCGVVAAITPFNFPLNLVCHKVGPGLAAGNSVIVKPASDTPLSAIKMVEILLEAGIPPLAISCITGSGGTVGNQLSADERIRKISFTGSAEVGKIICQTAGLKKVTMELGSNSPLIVMPDADLEKVANATIATGYGNAGQVCISAQRVIALDSVYGDLLDVLQPKVAAIQVGDQVADGTTMGPMIRQSDAERVHGWINEAVDQGAQLLCGGEQSGCVVSASLLADVKPDMKISRDEVFGPAVGVTRASSIDEAIALANDTRFGLSAGIFTQDIDAAIRFAKEVDSGNLQINWGPAWRADLMPYGGLKDSGLGKEGPSYAVQEMTEEKMVVIHS